MEGEATGFLVNEEPNYWQRALWFQHSEVEKGIFKVLGIIMLPWHRRLFLLQTLFRQDLRVPPHGL